MSGGVGFTALDRSFHAACAASAATLFALCNQVRVGLRRAAVAAQLFVVNHLSFDPLLPVSLDLLETLNSLFSHDL
jgi:hypothetical protein